MYSSLFIATRSCTGIVRLHVIYHITQIAYGQAHMGTPMKNQCGAQIASPYWPSVECIRSCPYGHANMGPIRSSPYGHTHLGPMRTSAYRLANNGLMCGPDSNHIWSKCGMYTSYPYGHVHIGPICVPYGHSHMDTPINDPCGPR